MAISDEITRLYGVRSDIFDAIAEKGVAVPPDSVLSSCPGLIASIPTGGGGGDPTGMIHSGFSGTGSMTYYQPFTAEQKQVPVYDEVSSALSLSWGEFGGYGVYEIKRAGSSWFDLDGSSRCKLRFTFTTSWQSPPSTGSVYSYTYNVGATVGTWAIKDSSMNPFTAEAEFTASSDQPMLSLALDGLIPWAFTGNTGVTGYKYEQTGTDFPYPQYDLTTTGAVSGNVTGVEYWSSWNNYYSGTVSAPVIRWSGFNDMLYGSGPSTHDTVTSFHRLDTPFVSGYLNSAISSSVSTGSLDTGYTYSFGPVESSYQGYTGI